MSIEHDEKGNRMDIERLNSGLMGRVPPRLANWLYKHLKNIPAVKATVDKELEKMMASFEDEIKSYRKISPGRHRLPASGLGHEDILTEMETLHRAEASRWQKGYASGAVYHGDRDHIAFLNRVYALNSQSNPLHSDLWPSSIKYESEIVAMTANMLGAAAAAGSAGAVCGVVSSGGTESILLAMKTYRDRARAVKGIESPEMVIPTTAHAAFEKAAQYFNIRLRRIPVGKDYRADVRATRLAINRNTIAVVGSAPSFPHGVIDPIEPLSELARKKGIGFHTDACLGGFVLPWAERLGYEVPAFDFRLPGVTSISADTHKYGYAAKGTSVILYRDPELRRYQYYTTSEWPGGLYFSPTFAGSRAGALSAACWAALVAVGEDGYLKATGAILNTAAKVKEGIRRIPGLFILGDPLWVVAFGSTEFDIYRVMDFMTDRHWSLNGLHKPACVHLCVTLRHTQDGVADRFVADLTDAVEHVRKNPEPEQEGGMAPMYGMAGTLPVRTLVSELLQRYIDMLYRV
jgi:glutamate/tyrosine decarboxylase-like PLP-dependent enzyme